MNFGDFSEYDGATMANSLLYITHQNFKYSDPKPEIHYKNVKIKLFSLYYTLEHYFGGDTYILD